LNCLGKLCRLKKTYPQSRAVKELPALVSREGLPFQYIYGLKNFVKRTKNWFSVLPSLVIPVCLGLSLYLGLLALIDKQILDDETLLRYLTGHPVSKISVGLFLVGCSSLALIGWDVFLQFYGEKRINLAGLSSTGQESGGSAAGNTEDGRSSELIAEQAAACSEELLALPIRFREHYLWQRLASGIQSIYRTGSVAKVEEELKYLADLDRDKQQQRYSLVQILIWATPMLGFLGTVLGISQALGGIAVGPDNDFQQMMDGLKGSLYVAFDTTALALTLSMILMFGQFLVDRFESQLLQLVDYRVHYEITQQFDLSIPSNTLESPDRDLGHRLVAAIELASEKQTSAWERSVMTVGRNWTDAVQSGYQHLDQDLNEAIDFSVSRLARSLEEAIDRADLSMSHRWEQWQVMLSENARQIAKNQGELIAQTQALCHLIEKQGVISSTWDSPAIPAVAAVCQIQQKGSGSVFSQAIADESNRQPGVLDPSRNREGESLGKAREKNDSGSADFLAKSQIRREALLPPTLEENFRPLKLDRFRKPAMTSVPPETLKSEADRQIILPFETAKATSRSSDTNAVLGKSEPEGKIAPQSSLAEVDGIPDPLIVPFIRKVA
jgi:biopolymer transport protein ExbB/TolQ